VFEFELRPYQATAIERVREAIRQGARRVLLVLATGGGKTFTAGKIIQNTVNNGKRAIFLAHRKELIEQCSSALDILGIDHGVIKRDHPRRDRSKPVQVASIQTLIRRDHWEADLIVIDEAHRSTANTYVKLINRYNNDPIILGISATPWRESGQPLGRKYDDNGNEIGFGFDAIVEVISTQELVDDGYLVKPTVFGCANPDLSALEIGAKGDYSDKSASKAIQKTILHGEIISNWAKICGEATGAETIWGEVPVDENGDEIQGELFINEVPGKTRRKVLHTDCNACTVAFLPTVEDSKKLADQFNAIGVPAAHLDGNTSDAKRTQILNDLRDRKIYVVTSVDVLVEGYDLPTLECIIAARITRSKGRFKQMGGRLMRPDDDKRFAYLLDHANWTKMHGFLTDPCEHSLTGREKRPRKDGSPAPSKECPQCGTLHPLMTRICEECGYEFPARETVFTDEDLVELNGKKISSKSLIPLETRQKAFNRYAARCVEEKHNPKQAEVLYMKEFDEWPTRDTGIVQPKFFWQYKRNFQQKKSQQATAQKAANQA
jgi:DNA repair protein RadD